ncbi:MAG: hypothetical protein MUE35_13495 [Hydrogenophaga sp.]|nr:hypothetical protein [Hydrogenophaga sp.]
MRPTQDSAGPDASARALQLAHEAADELFSIAEVMQLKAAHAVDDDMLWVRCFAIRLEQLGTVILGLNENFESADELEAVLRGPMWARSQRKGQ